MKNKKKKGRKIEEKKRREKWLLTLENPEYVQVKGGSMAGVQK